MSSNLADVARGPTERAHLELTHHELCTALTSARSNVELVRIALRRATVPQDQGIVEHLSELEVAIDRLERLARDVRARHAVDAS